MNRSFNPTKVISDKQFIQFHSVRLRKNKTCYCITLDINRFEDHIIILVDQVCKIYWNVRFPFS